MTGYRLATYQAANGPRAGIIIGDSVFDAASLTGRPSYASVLGLLEDWPRAGDAIQTAMRTNPANGFPLAATHLRAPVLWPSAIYCAGANYRDHALEMAKRLGRPLDPDPKASGGAPWHFLKASRCVTDPGATVAATSYSKKLDWEVELAAVIGRPTRNIPVERALDCVAGYTCANDLSARDLSKRPEASEKSPFHFDWTCQKSFDGSCPLGPWIVPADDIPDPQDLFLKLWVNDVLKQDSNTSEMIFTLADQIAHLSRGMTLYPGDLILTGTPAGVGTGRGEFLNSGDVVKIEIERIGTLSNRIV
jgi:2-keto-4-pentenoate hydratase/2-oxohepta-3-ene-1,7-dioic acid hydratase in catechol pathway